MASLVVLPGDIERKGGVFVSDAGRSHGSIRVLLSAHKAREHAQLGR